MGRRLVALAIVLGLAAAPAGAQSRKKLLERGKGLYAAFCVSCHGPRGEGVAPLGPKRGAGGVRGAGPSLRGAGAAAADFYLSTGYMPLRSSNDQPHRRRPPFDEGQLEALVAYVASLGGGPPVPKPRPERGRLSEGLKLFTAHCAGCHQVVGVGGVVTGDLAPSLEDATPTQVAEAVRIGPYVMPSFPRSQISDRQLDSIVRYVEYAKSPNDRGGWSIGHLGPVPEGLVAWLIAGAALVAVAVLIGKRLRE